MDAVATAFVRCKTANIVVNAQLGGPVEIAAYDSKWNVTIILTMMKVNLRVSSITS